MTRNTEDGLVTVAPAAPCRVGPKVRSQWRNGPHWHAVWPYSEGYWCYPTREAAQERAVDVNAIWRDYPHLRPRPISPEEGRDV